MTMKIIAQSLVAAGGLPYVHLGYLAAYARPTGTPKAAASATGAATSTKTGGTSQATAQSSSATGAAAKAKAGGTPQATVESSSATAAAAGVKTAGAMHDAGLILAAVGMVAVSLWLAGKIGSRWEGLRFLRRTPRALLLCGAVLFLAGLAGLTVACNQGGGEVSANPEQTTWDHAQLILGEVYKYQRAGKPVPTDARQVAPSVRDALDGWAHPLRLEVNEIDGVKRHSVVSAGPDGVFGTPDDLRFPRGR
jgi:hypothetical protein